MALLWVCRPLPIFSTSVSLTWGLPPSPPLGFHHFLTSSLTVSFCHSVFSWSQTVVRVMASSYLLPWGGQWSPAFPTLPPVPSFPELPLILLGFCPLRSCLYYSSTDQPPPTFDFCHWRPPQAILLYPQLLHLPCSWAHAQVPAHTSASLPPHPSPASASPWWLTLSSQGLPVPPHSSSGHLWDGLLSLRPPLSLSPPVSLSEQSLPALTHQPVRQPRLPAVSWGIDKDKWYYVKFHLMTNF